MTTDELIEQAGVPVPREVLREIVRQIVEVADPEKIILFGSAARGKMGPDSDLDLLVIKRGDYHHISAAQQIYHALSGIGYPKDVLVVTPEEAEEYRDCFALVLYPALREGVVLYERPAL